MFVIPWQNETDLLANILKMCVSQYITTQQPNAEKQNALNYGTLLRTRIFQTKDVGNLAQMSSTGLRANKTFSTPDVFQRSTHLRTILLTHKSVGKLASSELKHSTGVPHTQFKFYHLLLEEVGLLQ